MPLGPVQAGLAERMAGGAPPPAPAGPPPGPGGGMQVQPPGMQPPGMEGGDPVQRLAEALGEARMAIGEMGPERFATEGKDLLRGFVGSVTQLQMQMGGAQAGGNQPMPAGPGGQMQGPPPMPAGPVGP